MDPLKAESTAVESMSRNLATLNGPTGPFNVAKENKAQVSSTEFQAQPVLEQTAFRVSFLTPRQCKGAIDL